MRLAFTMIFTCYKVQDSHLYQIFGSKTDVSNLAGTSTTTLSSIASAITGVSTLNSALCEKADVPTLNNFMANAVNNLATKANVIDVYIETTTDSKLLNYPTHLDFETYVRMTLNDYLSRKSFTLASLIN